MYFRLGDDHKGIHDLEAALNYQPANLLAKEKLALAFRRLGKFDEAMKVTSSIMGLKEEERKKKAFAEGLAKRKELMRATESITTASSLAGYSSVDSMPADHEASDIYGDEKSEVGEHGDDWMEDGEIHSRERTNSHEHIHEHALDHSGSKHNSRLSKRSSRASNANSSTAAVTSMMAKATKCPIQGNVCCLFYFILYL